VLKNPHIVSTNRVWLPATARHSLQLCDRVVIVRRAVKKSGLGGADLGCRWRSSSKQSDKSECTGRTLRGFVPELLKRSKVPAPLRIRKFAGDGDRFAVEIRASECWSEIVTRGIGRYTTRRGDFLRIDCADGFDAASAGPVQKTAARHGDAPVHEHPVLPFCYQGRSRPLGGKQAANRCQIVPCRIPAEDG